MIVDLEQFIARERPAWERLAARLDELSRDPWATLSLEQARELDALYQRASSDLARIATLSAEPQTRAYLEHLVARAHAEIYSDTRRQRFAVTAWLAETLPQAFRRRVGAFWLALALTVAGAVFGGATLAFDPAAKEVLMPFDHLQQSPSERVAQEKLDAGQQLDGNMARFSGTLMTHNTRVTLTAMAFGMTWGVGTLILLFYNGVILGAVAVDYLLSGEALFLFGWLLPHGAVEIPAILLGGQAGLVLAGALLGRGDRRPLRSRLRQVVPDVVALVFGAVIMLIWAGLVEAFFSQYHEPVLPYGLKIGFGTIELAFVIWYFFWFRQQRRPAR